MVVDEWPLGYGGREGTLKSYCHSVTLLVSTYSKPLVLKAQECIKVNRRYLSKFRLLGLSLLMDLVDRKRGQESAFN